MTTVSLSTCPWSLSEMWWRHFCQSNVHRLEKSDDFSLSFLFVRSGLSLQIGDALTQFLLLNKSNTFLPNRAQFVFLNWFDIFNSKSVSFSSKIFPNNVNLPASPLSKHVSSAQKGNNCVATILMLDSWLILGNFSL